MMIPYGSGVEGERYRDYCTNVCETNRQCMQPDDCWNEVPVLMPENALAWQLYREIGGWDRSAMSGQITGMKWEQVLTYAERAHGIRGAFLIDEVRRLRVIEQAVIEISGREKPKDSE